MASTSGCSIALITRAVIARSPIPNAVWALAPLQSPAHVSPAPCAGGERPLLDRVVPVRRDGVAVQVSADLAQLNEPGKRARPPSPKPGARGATLHARCLELTSVLAQLGLDVVQPESGVYLLLRAAAARDAGLVIEDP